MSLLPTGSVQDVLHATVSLIATNGDSASKDQIVVEDVNRGTEETCIPGIISIKASMWRDTDEVKWLVNGCLDRRRVCNLDYDASSRLWTGSSVDV